MDRHSKKTAFAPACRAGRWLAAALVAVCSIAASALAQSSWRAAAGAVSSTASSVPLVSASTAADGTQSLVYRFTAPHCLTAADGMADISIAGLVNMGPVGAPSLPVLPVRIAIPQGREVKSATVSAGAYVVIARDVDIRPVQRQVAPGAPVPALARDAGIYASSDPYPAQPYGKWTTARKSGVLFYETTLKPVSYLPATGEVRFYAEMTVRIELAPAASTSSAGSTGRAARRSASSTATSASSTSATAPYVSARAAADVLALVDNPAVAASYSKTASSTTARRSSLASAASGLLPCASSASYAHVIITSEAMSEAFEELAQYRRDGGLSSVVVTVEEIKDAYTGVDVPEQIRAFIQDAYATWGAEYVVLGGGVDVIPARFLLVTEVDELTGEATETLVPSDVYYQCLDGDFDGNGNGVYGEAKALEDGGDEPDLYAEVKIGRIPAASAEDVARWLAKAKRYDAAFSSDDDTDYRQGALFVSEILEGTIDDSGTLVPAALVDCYGAKLMEHIRIGSAFPGNRTGITTYGFCDATNDAAIPSFLASNLQTLYDKDRDPRYNTSADGLAWTADELLALLNGDSYSIVNHVGHSSYLENMRLDNTTAQSLANTKPFFVYSQGCNAGAFDEDCMATLFTVGLDGGAFGGVWNSREGRYVYNKDGVDAGVSTGGYGQYFHRRFWDAVFRLGERSLGGATTLSHEQNAGYVPYYGSMALCFYESNLFGDPAQFFGGPDKVLSFDRDAYRPDAVATLTYEALGATDENVTVTLSAVDSDEAAVAFAPGVYTADVTLEKVSETEALVTYSATVDLSAFRLSHEDTLFAVLADATNICDSAAIDNVAPQITAITAYNPDDDVVTVSWTTDEDTAGLVLIGTALPLADDSLVITAETYATSQAVTFDGLEPGLYYISVVAYDEAANTNSSPASLTSTTAADYTRIVVAPRETRASYDMESGTSAWSLSPVTSTSHTNCWQVGVPKYGPVGATRCWGTVLDGRYPDGANDALVSPAITLRATPAITFRQWYDTEETPYGYGNLPGADCGIVEVCATLPDGSIEEGTYADGTWRNISEFSGTGVASAYSGSSSGWESVRVNLPAAFTGLSIRIRFRFLSDTYTSGLGNPAGWYIDGVTFLDTPVEGIVLSAVEIDDGGDDGQLSPDETAAVTLASFNKTFADITPVSATLSISAAGYTVADVSMDGASSTTLSYATIAAGASAEAAAPININISSNVAVGTVVTLRQVLTDTTGTKYTSSLLLRVAKSCVLTGTVLQPTGNPLIGATVAVNGSDGQFSAVTDETGAYEITGLPRGSIVMVDVSYGYAGTNVPFTASSARETLDFTLPVAEIGVDESSFIVHLLSTDAPVAYSFIITNYFTLAAADGNEGPSCDLVYEVTGFLDDAGNALDWFTPVFDTAGSVEPEGTVLFGFELDPRGKDSSYTRKLTLKITSNAWNADVVEIPVVFVIDGVVETIPAGSVTSDNYYVVDSDGEVAVVEENDYDGVLEPGGEIGTLRLAICNSNEYETITRFDGTVTVDSSSEADVTILADDGTEYDDDVLTWRNVAPGVTQLSDDVVYIQWNSGTVAHFVVTGDAYFRDGLLSTPQELHFYVTNNVCNAAESLFLKVAARSESETTNAVVDAYVVATGADGEVLYSTPTTTNGVFLLSGLEAGAPYWISYEIDDSDTDTVPPPAFLLTADDNPASTDSNGSYLDLTAIGASYTNAAHLRLLSVTVDDADGDGYVDPGEEISLAISLMSDSYTPVYPLTATLTTPDFEQGSDGEFIAITELTGDAFNGTGASSLLIDGISALVSDSAATGDFQRFLLTVTDGSEEARTWYFDFVVKVDTHSMVHGSVTTAVADGMVAGTQIAIMADDGSYYNTVTLTNETPLGEFSFGPYATGTDGVDYTVAVVSVPTGYACLDKTQTVHLASADVTLDPFELVKYGITATVGDGTDDGISLSVLEGQSTNAVVTIANGGDVEASVDVQIVYNRKKSEILAVDDITEATAVATLVRSLSNRIGTDWTGLDPAVFSTSEIEVLFKEGTPVSVRDDYLARHGFVAKHHFATIPASIAVPASGSSSRALSSAALADARAFTLSAEDADCVVAVQPSVLCQVAQAVPDDELYAEQWALNNTRQNGGTLGVDIGAEEAWEYAQSFGSQDVIVAVTDSGVNFTHPDLADNVTDDGYNFVSSLYLYYPPTDFSDADGHGTHVAGIIGAVGNNGIGVSGVNGAVSILSCRINAPNPFTGATVWATSGEIAQAIEYAYTHGAKVDNASWGSSEYSSLIDAVIIKAQDYDMLLVCAAGNSALDLDITRSYPAALKRDNVIVVAASDSDGHIAEFSNYSPSLVHLAAPGVDILSTYLSPEYTTMSGTSMAAPYVSGAAAFLYSISPSASYSAIKNALLAGVRKDDELVDFVSTSGILDLGTSVKLLGRQWLRFEADEILLSTNVTLAAGETIDLPVLINDAPALAAGTYSASIDLSDANGSAEVPVTLEVVAAPVAEIAAANVLDANGDGYISCGEETSLSITVRNVGSLPFEALTGVLSGPGTISTSEVDYDYVSEVSTSDPGVFEVTLPTGTDTAEYVLSLYDGGELVAELPVTVSLFDGTVVEVTVTDDGEPVVGAVVEVVGASAGRALTDTNGVAKLAVAASASSGSSYVIRVIASGAIRATESYGSLPATATFALEHAAVTTADGATEASFTISEGVSFATNVSLVATADLSADFVLVPRAKIAVMDDASSGAELVAALKRDGYDVDWYTNNYGIVKHLNEATGVASISYSVQYSWDDATLFGYDAVIALVTGSTGSGRLLVDAEYQAYADYIARGGKVFFAGQTVLAVPDNDELASYLGFDPCVVTNVAGFIARAESALGGAPFIELAAGDAFPSSAGAYDAVFAADAASGEALASMDDDDAPVSKLFQGAENSRGGRAWLWNGLGDDWASEGASLDVLRGILHGLFVDGQSVDWLVASATSLDAAAGETNEVALTVNPLLTLATGEYEAVLLLSADTDNGPVAPVIVKVSVEPPALRAHNLSGAITDWGDRLLSGDGGTDSCMVQVVYAGADGVIDPPEADGSASGDDVILAVSGSGATCTYVGAGENVLADAGQFDEQFALAFAGYTQGDTGVVLYARAWDSSTAASSIAYGDSALVEVTYADGLPKAIDFGSWVVSNAVDAVRDLNGDGIPDAWAMTYRPDLDPTDPVAALETESGMTPSNFFNTAKAPTNKDADGNPARAFVTDKFVFVLEQYQHRIAVYDRAAPHSVVRYFGATTKNGAGVNYDSSTALGTYLFSSADGGFNQPFGLAYDTFCTNLNRFAVADTGNSRVQLFTFDPDTAEITFVAAYGSKNPNDGSTDADTSLLLEPKALAFMKGSSKGGDLLVADTGNYRVLRLKTSGNAFVYNTKYAFDNNSDLAGICYDSDTSAGFWVADAGNLKRRISYHRISGFSSEPTVAFTFRTDNSTGNASVDDVFADVQVWPVGSNKRLCAVDYDGSRLLVLGTQASSSGAYTNVSVLADIGYYGDASLQDYEKLWHPNGVFPLADTNIVYVADYGHEKIKWYALTLDADGDGMDDFWEDANGLDSTVNDALEDADNDGLPNIGEYRAGTDPQNTDTDGDGAGDLTEMAYLRDPLEAEDETLETLEFVSLATFDADGAAKTRFAVGDTVVVVATFGAAPSGGSITLKNMDGDSLGGGQMTVSDETLVFSYVATEDAVGTNDVRLVVAECEPAVITGEDLFSVFAETPEEEYEEVRWGFASIDLDSDGTVVVLGWEFPDKNVAETGTNAGQCLFRIEYCTDLTSGTWTELATPSASDATGCTQSTSLEELGSPSSCFFRIWWTNKVVE